MIETEPSNFFGFPLLTVSTSQLPYIKQLTPEAKRIGLKHIPKFQEPRYESMDVIMGMQAPVEFQEANPKDVTAQLFPWVHFDSDTQEIFQEYFLQIRDDAEAICEIGVDAFHEDKDIGQAESSTNILLKLKKQETLYLGIDFIDKSYLNNREQNVYTINSDSRQRYLILKYMHRLGMHQLDFLFIDGNHSLSTTLSDWMYTEKLKVGGIVSIHDIHWHPGPALVFDAIDENYFDKYAYFTTDFNWGIGFARKIKPYDIDSA
jgi:hypothetical protein